MDGTTSSASAWAPQSVDNNSSTDIDNNHSDNDATSRSTGELSLPDPQAPLQAASATSPSASASRRPPHHGGSQSFTSGVAANNNNGNNNPIHGHNSTLSGDVESLLRQWGAAPTADNDANDVGGAENSNNNNIHRGVFGMDSTTEAGSGTVPISNSFDATIDTSERIALDTIEGGRIATTGAGSNSRHRRIASTGGVSSIPIGSLSLISTPRGLERGMSERGGMMMHRSHSDDQDGVALHSLDGRSSAIHDAARITNWGLVASLSKSDPEAAKYAGPDRWTALHHACSRRCPHADVIDALLRAYPEALLQTDDRGWTPLHHACRFKAPREVVRLLLRAYPELGKRAASGRCSMARSPLYYAIRYDAPEGVVDMLLLADPGAVLDEDRDGVCPLGLVWDKYASGFDGKRTLHALLRPFEGEGETVGGGAESEATTRRSVILAAAERKVREAMKRPACKQLRAKWQKVNCLLRAYFHFPLQEDDEMEETENVKIPAQQTESSLDTMKKRKWRVLHAVSAIKCHHMLFLLARALHPEEAHELDENDLLGGGREVTSIPDPLPSSLEKRKPISNRTALHFASMSPLAGREGRNVIKILLSLNPDAARHTDGYGCLPLHLLASNDRKVHWTQDGLRDVYNSYSDAPSCKDCLGRTPLHCAASASGHYVRPPPSPTQSTRPVSPTAAIGPAQPQTLQPQAHFAADTARDVGSVIQNLVLANRNAAAVADKTGRLPLHYIAEHGEEWNSDAECILAAHPAAARSRAGPLASARLPLHMAASSTDAHPSLIMNLVHANPRAASLTDGTGRLPLHLACESGRTTWDRGIESIYSAFTNAIFTTEDSPRRWTVLHTAAASPSAGCELIETILKLNRNAASMADGEGKHPLHLACATNRSWEDGGVRILFEADPSAALVEDHRGLLPFHIAAIRGSDEVFPRDDISHARDVDDLVEDSVDDLSTLDVLYNLLTAQPSIVRT